jgi:c-di-GMP-binding flagellar brake protein YcgR
VRSIAEIAPVLDAMRQDGDLVTSSVAHAELLFLSRVRHVDARGNTIALALCEHNPANHALLEAGHGIFRCNHRGTHYEFSAQGARAFDIAGEPAIALDFPEALLALQRRAHPRYSVPPRVPLRCEVQLGPLSFDATIVDVSLGGIGALVYDAGIHLEPGLKLPRTRILHPQRRPIVADLEVRHIRPVALPDGRQANRAGCSMNASPQDLEALVRLFVTDLK